jgi:hypothetical protein
MVGDGRYRYCAHFEGAATLVDTVIAVLESFQPLPVAAVRVSGIFAL